MFWNTVEHQLLSCGFELAKSVLKEKRLELKPSGWTRSWKELQKLWTEQHWLNVSLTVLSTHMSLRHLSQDEAFADVAVLECSFNGVEEHFSSAGNEISAFSHDVALAASSSIVWVNT